MKPAPSLQFLKNKVRLNMIDKLQEKTIYDGQSEYYRNLQ